jgi:hypothetical protein
MTDILEKARQSSNKPTVEESRPDRADDGPTLVQAEVSQDELKAFKFAAVDEARAAEIKHADARGEASRLRFEAMAPVFKLIEADEKAKDALKRSDLIIHEIGLAAAGQRIRSDPIGFPIQWGWSLDPGFNVFGKPYNGERQGPTHGAGATSKANRNTAEMTVTIPFDKDSEGTRTAEASLQFIFEAKVAGTVSLRPFIQYEGQSIIEGQWLSAFSRGVLFVSAAKWFDQSTLVMREEVLWSH